LQAAALDVRVRPTGVEEIAVAAIASIGRTATVCELDVAPDLAVSADPALLERALANVISNALRAAPPGTSVRVTAGRVRAADRETVDVRVIDHGPGIRVADRDRVFQPFQRAVDHGADSTGVGLGLAIARGFVEAMGGEVVIEDTPGGGTTIVISVPTVAGATG
jgi:two-component system sensor histidine kinase KdpD